MKLITLKKAKELRSASRIDQPYKHWKCFDGASWHYYCWLDGIIEWLEKRQASSLRRYVALTTLRVVRFVD